MRNTIFIGSLTLAFVLALACSAGAVTINGVDFTLFANKRIGMEHGNTVINGNVAVNDPNGELAIGAHNTINGTATANKIIAGSFQQTTECDFNILTGQGAAGCLTQVTPVTLPLTAWPPLPVAALPACVDVAPNVTVPDSTTQSLAPGCYGVVTVGKNATLNLSAGTYNLLDLSLDNQATVTGAGSSATIVNSKKVITINGGSTLTGLTLQTPLTTTSEVIQVGPSSTLNDVVLNAPGGKIHVHLGTIGTNVEVVGNTLEIEPVNLSQPPQVSCGCVTSVAKINSTTIHVTGEHLAAFTSYVLKTDCNPAGGIAATKVAGGTDTDQDLTVPANTTCTNCHVIGISAGGSFCTADLVTLP